MGERVSREERGERARGERERRKEGMVHMSTSILSPLCECICHADGTKSSKWPREKYCGASIGIMARVI